MDFIVSNFELNDLKKAGDLYYAGNCARVESGKLCVRQSADFRYFGKYADIPQCEFWSWFDEKGDYCVDVGNARVPAYLAHFWGRRYVGAEAFTSYHGAGGRWLTTPFKIKAQADRAFAEGVNRLTFHRFAHQPWVGPSAPKPGMTMGCWGMHFDRTQTWWKQGQEWMKYLGRCQWMLQEGRFAADFLFVAGDDVPNRGGHLVGFPKDFNWWLYIIC